MDNTIITYMLKASVSIALFYGIYMLFMRNDTFLRLRRFYFLFAIFVSVLYPFRSLQLSTDDIQHLPSFVVNLMGFEEQPMTQATIELGEMEAGYLVAATETGKTIEPTDILLIVLILVMLLLALRFIVQLFSVLKLRMNNISEKYGSCRIVKLEDRKSSPFSFFNWIFINITGRQEQQEIIAHEEVHARQFHTIDIILTEIFCICFWWNPFAWLLRREVKINLEYLADEGVLKNGYDTRGYQYLLLQTSKSNTGISIINNFNVSQLKKRIIMMNKKESPVLLSAKYLLMIPIAVGLILSNAVKASPAMPIENEPTANELFDSEIIVEVLDIDEPAQSPDDKPYNTVEQMPNFPGGQSAMMKFITDNMRYPDIAAKNNVQGRVAIRFVVAKDGTIKDVSVIRGLSAECDAEAKRVVELMPKWTPGKHKGKEVDVYFTLPVVFKMTGGTKDKGSSKAGGTPNKETKLVEPKTTSNNTKAKPKSDKPFLSVDQMPSFPGGEAAMQKFIAENLKYPVEAQEKKIQGRVTIRFMVGVDGSITEATVIRGISPECDSEALRTINSMPKWVPGKQNGVVVPVYYTIPIVYRLKSNDKEKALTDIPTFPGGHDAFLKFMAQNLKYPVEAQKKSETAIVNIAVKIKNTGEISSVSSVGNASKVLSDEVIRVAKLMPKWNAGKSTNTNEVLTYMIPVVFQLRDKTDLIKPEGEIPPNAIVVIGYGS